MPGKKYILINFISINALYFVFYSSIFSEIMSLIYPFTYKVMGQETYYNSVGALMQAWDNAVKKVKGLIKEDEILNGI